MSRDTELLAKIGVVIVALILYVIVFNDFAQSMQDGTFFKEWLGHIKFK